MISSKVFIQLTKTLENNPNLKGYIKYVYQGRRFDFEPDSLPCIMLEPSDTNEILREVSTYKEVSMTIDIYSFSNANYADGRTTIVGDQSYKGILDIENDIRAVLQSSNTLGTVDGTQTAIDMIVGQTFFDQLDINEYPVRGLLMPVRIKYRQFQGE